MKSLQKNAKLKVLAQRYVWWESPDWAYSHPEVFLANIMNLGNWEDIQEARKILGDSILKEALLEAPPGYYGYRAWDYWHLKFGLTPIPPLPQRKFQ